MSEKTVSLEIRGTRLFKQVAKVLGEDEAYSQLLKVFIREVRHGQVLKTNERLLRSFNWRGSPQGNSYWAEINRKTGD